MKTYCDWFALCKFNLNAYIEIHTVMKSRYTNLKYHCEIYWYFSEHRLPHSPRNYKEEAKKYLRMPWSCQGNQGVPCVPGVIMIMYIEVILGIAVISIDMASMYGVSKRNLRTYHHIRCDLAQFFLDIFSWWWWLPSQRFILKLSESLHV